MPFVSDIIPTPLLPPAYRGLHCQSLQPIVSINALRFARPCVFRNLPSQRAAGLSSTIAACQRETQPQQPQQTFPKVALTAVLDLFQNRLPFVQCTAAFSSYLRSLSARASAPTYLTISSRSARLNKKTARYFSALDILCISSLLASSLQNCSIQPICRAAVFSSLSLKTQLCLSLEARPCHTAWMEIQQHQLPYAMQQQEQGATKKNTSQQAQHQNMLAAPPKRDMTMIYGYELSVQHEYGMWICDTGHSTVSHYNQQQSEPPTPKKKNSKSN